MLEVPELEEASQGLGFYILLAMFIHVACVVYMVYTVYVGYTVQWSSRGARLREAHVLQGH